MSITENRRIHKNYQRPFTDRNQKQNLNNRNEINYKILNTFSTKNKPLNIHSNTRKVNDNIV